MDMNQKIYSVIGAAMAVHSELKSGLLEPVYQDALSIEFSLRNIPFQKEYLQNVYYKGNKLDKFYKFDFLCFDDLIVELKATETLLPEHRFQLFNYMRLSKINFGILINFGENSLKSEPYFWDEQTNRCHLLRQS